MARGRKPELADNVVGFPLSAEPLAVHIERAQQLLPDGELSPAEVKVWDRVAPHLAMLGRLKPHYVDALCEYCRVIRRLADARRLLDEQDWIYITGGRNGEQFKSRPEVAQLNDDWRKWRSLVGEFGLAPAADRGLQSDQTDMFDGFDDL